MSVIFSSEAFQTATPLFSIREETPSDVAAREALLDRAMGLGRTLKSSESIRRRRLAAEGLSFSAVGADHTLLGTVRLWNITAGDRDGVGVQALLLGPLAVAPQVKGAGIGGALMRHAIAAAAGLGHGAILLVGDLDYYVRFGFSAARTGDLVMPGPFDPARLLALELGADTLVGVIGRITPTGPFSAFGALQTPAVAAAA